MKTICRLLLLGGVFLISCGGTALASLPDEGRNEWPAAVYQLKLRDFAKLTPGEIAQISGKKLNGLQRVSYAVLKLRMKKALRTNPDMTVGAFLQSWAVKKSDIIYLILFVVLVVIVIVISRAFPLNLGG